MNCCTNNTKLISRFHKNIKYNGKLTADEYVIMFENMTKDE